MIKDVKFSVLRKRTTKEHLQRSEGGGQEVEGNNRNTVKSIMGKTVVQYVEYISKQGFSLLS